MNISENLLMATAQGLLGKYAQTVLQLQLMTC